MRVVFMGTPDFAVPTLNALHMSQHTLELVVAQPDRPSGRGQRTKSPPTIRFAKERAIPTAQPKALRSGPFAERMQGMDHDVSVVIAYGRILPKAMFDSGKYGAINLHASLLPRWRGAAPIAHAILAGDTKTGVCAQQMEPDLDTGPLIAVREAPIGPTDNAGTLHDRLAELAAEVTLQALDALPDALPTPQDSRAVTWAPKLSREDGRISFDEAAESIDLRIRAMTPWPGAWVPRNHQVLKIKRAHLADLRGPPGIVLAVDPLSIACNEGAIVLHTVQAAGRREVSGADFANGAHLRAGEPFTTDAD